MTGWALRLRRISYFYYIFFVRSPCLVSVGLLSWQRTIYDSLSMGTIFQWLQMAKHVPFAELLQQQLYLNLIGRLPTCCMSHIECYRYLVANIKRLNFRTNCTYLSYSRLVCLQAPTHAVCLARRNSHCGCIVS